MTSTALTQGPRSRVSQARAARERRRPDALEAAPVVASPQPEATERLTGISLIASVVTDLALVTLIGLFAFEAAARYGLALVGLDSLIFARDGLAALAILLLFVDAVARKKGVAPFLLFGVAISFHGMVTLLTLGSAFAVVFGAKILMTFLLGIVAWDRLTRPGSTLRYVFAIVFVATIVGVVLDKFLLDFPWLGVTIEVGGVERELGRQWWTEDERAGGFARSSIEIAQITPLLALTVLGYARGFGLRAMMIVATLAVVYWTTQKGAILALLLTAPCLMLPPRVAGHALNGVILFSLILAIGMPLILPGYSMPSADGVFSPMSFYLRVEEVWPDSFAWVERMGNPFVGVGLGGAGGSLHYIAPEHYTPLDNIFLFFYAQFGLMGAIYLIAPAIFALMQPPARDIGDLTSRALLAFIYGYGVVLTVVESQMGSLFLGAAISALIGTLQPVSSKIESSRPKQLAPRPRRTRPSRPVARAGVTAGVAHV